MVGQCASKAEVMVAVALDGRYDLVEVSLLDATLDGVDAVWGRTPFEIVFVIDIGAGEQFLVSLGRGLVLWRLGVS